MSTGNKRPLAVLTALALATGGAVTLAGGASAAPGGELVYGLTTDDRLVAFRSQTPGTIEFNRDITVVDQLGLPVTPQPDIVGLDVRPATGELYALGRNSQLYVVNPTNGQATARGAAITPALQGEQFGFDFNPVSDRARIVSNANQNLRVDPDTGGASAGTPAGATTDGALRYRDTDPNAGQDPNVAAAAYTQSVAGTTTTVQFDIDLANNSLVQQESNPGILTTIGNLGQGDVTNAGLDVSASTDTTFASLAVTSGTPATTTYAFYTVNRTTGAATRVGAFGPAATTATPALEVEDVTVVSSRFRVEPVTITEGGTANVTIRREGDTADSQSVTFSLVSGATGGVPGDANAVSGTVTFGPGETARTFPVTTLQDDFVEGTETLTVDLSAPTGGAVASDGTVTINDNEEGAAFGLTSENGLTTFDVRTPGTASAVVPITNIAATATVVGIDVRPRTGELYGVGSDSTVFTINPTTGRADNVRSLSVKLEGTAFGVDFNPVADRLRIVSNTEQNLRVNVDAPAASNTTVDGQLRYDPADPNNGVNPAVAAAAYTNSFGLEAGSTTAPATPTATTQFDIDAQTASLVRQDSNPGLLFTRGALGVTPSDQTRVGLDAASAGNALFAVFPTSTTGSSLYRVNETTGRATSLGVLGTPDQVGGAQDQVITDLALRGRNRASFTEPGATQSPSPTATPTMTPTATATPTPTVTGTTNPTLQPLVLRVERDTITPGVQGVVRITGTANRDIEVLAYSRPSTTYNVVRRVSLGEDGTAVIRILPGTNTRLYARYTGVANSDSRSVVQNVATALSLTVVRNGSLDYTFQGRILPRRAGQLITLYRVTNGREVITSQIRTDNSGTYRIRRVFTGEGTFGFLTRTGQNLTNVAGVSNGGRARPTSIYAGPQR